MLSAFTRLRPGQSSLRVCSRSLSTSRIWLNADGAASQPTRQLNEGEQVMFNKLTEKFSPTELLIQDLSGGCGSFYAIRIASPSFKGLTTVKQHRMVTDALKEEIGSIHGLQIKTTVS